MQTNDASYRNLVTGLGTAIADKTVHTQVAPSAPLSPERLSDIYMADGIGTKIVNCVADDATAKGWEISNDTKGELFAAMNALRIPATVGKAATFTRLYGGAIAVMMIADGIPLEQPRTVGKGEVFGVKVFSSGRVVMTQADFVKDTSSKFYDDIEVFTIKKRDNSTFRVHASRCVVFRGIDVPDCWQHASMEMEYFGVSALQGVFDRLAGLGSSMQGLDNMLLEPDVGIYGLNGLKEMASEDDNGIKKVQERMQVMHLSKNLLRALLLDKDDTYNQVSHSFTGIPESIHKEMQILSACADIPMTRLFGEAATGLNATGEGDKKNYDDKVMAFQTRTLSDPIARMATIVNDHNGKIIKGDFLQVNFAPVNTPTLLQMIDARFKQAQTDDLNIKNQIYSSEEARVNRIIGGYSFETVVEDGAK